MVPVLPSLFLIVSLLPEEAMTCMDMRQVVHSRAFSIPGRQGDDDISINMLMPLVDMLNHRGKECSFLFSDESEAEDNVRCDVRPISRSYIQVLQLVRCCQQKWGAIGADGMWCVQRIPIAETGRWLCQQPGRSRPMRRPGFLTVPSQGLTSSYTMALCKPTTNSP